MSLDIESNKRKVFEYVPVYWFCQGLVQLRGLLILNNLIKRILIKDLIDEMKNIQGVEYNVGY